jgi:hypothetical protein
VEESDTTAGWNGSPPPSQGDDYDWSLGPDRVLRLGLLFFVLIMVSTYTANLAAFFTAPNFTIFGPQVRACGGFRLPVLSPSSCALCRVHVCQKEARRSAVSFHRALRKHC